MISQPQLYEFNRSCKDPFHSDHLIISPQIPVIREEKEPYDFAEPWPLTVVSAPAVNAGVVKARGLGTDIDIQQRMKARIRRIVGAAYESGVTHLVLGEYGCGALQNEPSDVSVRLLLLSSAH